jgi:hypothetical protein
VGAAAQRVVAEIGSSKRIAGISTVSASLKNQGESLAMRCRLKKILHTKLNLVTVAAAPLSPHTIISTFSHFY